MKQNLNEIKRMQRLAGIITESESLEEMPSIDPNKLLRASEEALKSGKQVTVMGKQVTQVLRPAGAFKTAEGLVKIKDVASEDILIDGEPASNYIPKPQSPTPFTPSPEQIAKQRQDIAQRYGPGGVAKTGLGDYSGD